jgi:hypothetical protein
MNFKTCYEKALEDFNFKENTLTMNLVECELELYRVFVEKFSDPVEDTAFIKKWHERVLQNSSDNLTNKGIDFKSLLRHAYKEFHN